MKTEHPVFIYRALPTVSETDRQAMFDLRDALPADNDYALQWKRAGQKISLWEGVTLNEEGRVVGIGYDELKYLGNYSNQSDCRDNERNSYSR